MTDKAARARELADMFSHVLALRVPGKYPEQVLGHSDREIIMEALRAYDGGWQPIESAPKDGTVVLVRWISGSIETNWPDQVRISTAYWEKNHPCPHWREAGFAFMSMLHPTHWRPLHRTPAQRRTRAMIDTIITAPGEYEMRNGEKATIVATTFPGRFSCVGYIPDCHDPIGWDVFGKTSGPIKFDIIGPWREKASGTVERWVTKLHLTACDDVTEKWHDTKDEAIEYLIRWKGHGGTAIAIFPLTHTWHDGEGLELLEGKG